MAGVRQAARPVYWIALILFGCGLAERSLNAQTAVREKSAEPAAGAGADSRMADRTAIGALQISLAKSFVARDAAALASHWTKDGEYENEAGVAIQGREALEKAFAVFFTKSPEAKAQLRSESVRFLGQDAAICEGAVAVRKGPAQPTTRAHYSAFVVREEGRWRFAKLTESPADEPTIEELDWLIGEWKSARSDGAEIRTVYSWSTNRKFINVDFTIKEPTLTLSGKQVIGMDPATRRIRSWTFEANGGIGVGDWSRDGDHWVIEASGTLADGRALEETNVLHRVSDDVITWQSVNRSVEATTVPDLPPVRVTRVKPQR